MTNLLLKYNPKKISLSFYGFNIKVEESDKSIQLNQYANSLFTSFTIDSPEFEDKKGVFVFSVDEKIIYVGKTDDSLKKVIQGTYGKIVPRKLHTDGQITACKLNSFLNQNHDKKIELWFIPCENKENSKQIKNEIIAEYNPIINNNRSLK